MTFNWENHARHRAQVIEDHGQWVGILNENGEPIAELTSIAELTAPETRNQPTSMTCVINLEGDNTHLAVTELIANLGTTDAQGRLIPANTNTRLLAIQRAAMPRRVFRITHVVARGGLHGPSSLQVHGVDELDVLAGLPCPSVPSSWTSDVRIIDRDWAQLWRMPRLMAEIQIAEVSDGFTVSGPAEETIRRLIDESLQALWRVTKVKNDPPVVVSPSETSRKSPVVLIRPADGSIWEEVSPTALAAGVRVSVRMWWPGDEQLRGLNLRLPTYVVHVEQIAEVS